MSTYNILKYSTFVILPSLALALSACGEVGGSERASARTSDTVVPALPSRGFGGGSGAVAPADTIDLRNIGYALGDEDAPVKVYEFSDFGCPFCGMFARGTFPTLREEYVETGMVRWTYIPGTFGFPGGREGARAAECAAEQGKFWEMHDLLYENQNEWKGSDDPERLAGVYAGRIGLDGGRYASCYREDRGAERTALNNRAAQALRVRATPSFFINGRLVEGALPIERFRQALTAVAAER